MAEKLNPNAELVADWRHRPAHAFAHVGLPVVDVERHARESITGDLMTRRGEWAALSTSRSRRRAKPFDVKWLSQPHGRLRLVSSTALRISCVTASGCDTMDVCEAAPTQRRS
jgi:hypothetical protein